MAERGGHGVGSPGGVGDAFAPVSAKAGEAGRGGTVGPLRARAPLDDAAGRIDLREITDRALVTIALAGDPVRERLTRAFGVALPAVGRSIAAPGGERLLGLQHDRLYVMFERGDEGDGGDHDKTDPERELLDRIARRAAAGGPARRTDPKATVTDATGDTDVATGRDDDGTLLYSSDQSDSWAMLRLAGPASRRVLERVCPLDLHPDEFPVGAVARSVVEHLGVVVLREAADTWLLLSPRSSARSFLHEIETSVRLLRGAP